VLGAAHGGAEARRLEEIEKKGFVWGRRRREKDGETFKAGERKHCVVKASIQYVYWRGLVCPARCPLVLPLPSEQTPAAGARQASSTNKTACSMLASILFFSADVDVCDFFKACVDRFTIPSTSSRSQTELGIAIIGHDHLSFPFFTYREPAFPPSLLP